MELTIAQVRCLFEAITEEHITILKLPQLLSCDICEEKRSSGFKTLCSDVDVLIFCIYRDQDEKS